LHAGLITIESGCDDGMANNRMEKIVVIAPYRRVKSHILEKNAPNLQYSWERFSRDRKLKKSINLNVFLEYLSKRSNMYNDYLYEGYIPILRMDGEPEGENGILFLKAAFNNMTEPKKHITLNATGHYCNTTSVGDFMVYNNMINTELVNVIDD
jgi:hypothetical protein